MESNVTISNEVSITVVTDMFTNMLPRDLQLENNVSLLRENLSLLLSLFFTHSSQDLVEVFNNILNETHETGWQQLQTVGSGSQTLLRNAERYGAYLASRANNIDEPLVLVRENISEFYMYLHNHYMYELLHTYVDWYL